MPALTEEDVQIYEFTIVLGDIEVSDEQVETLYSVIDDGTQVCRDGLCFIRFDRDADTLENAIRSAVSDVEQAGLTVAKVELSRDSVTA